MISITKHTHWQKNHQNTHNSVKYEVLLKTRSLDNAIREFSLAKPSWYMSHYTMIYKKGERMRDFLGLFGLIGIIIWGRF